MAATLPTNSVYDFFAITDPLQRETLSSFNNVLFTEDTPGNISFNPTNELLSVKSTGGLSSILIGDTVTAPGPGFSVGPNFGFEVAILLPAGNLPKDFSALGTDRVFVGIENDQPSGALVAGFFISEAGIATANSSTSLNTILPGTDALIETFRKSSGEPLILRIAFKEDTTFLPIQHVMSVAIGQTTRQLFTFEQGSLPFIYTGDDRLNVEVIAPASQTRELLLGFMGLSSKINTYAVTTQPNPGPDDVAELGDVVRLDGLKSLPAEQIIVSGKDLRSAQVEPDADTAGAAISRLGNTVAGTGFTDTFTITAPATEAVAIPDTKVGDFIVINGTSYIIKTISFPAITVEEPQIPEGLTGATWKIFSRTIVESVNADLTGVLVGDLLRINTTVNTGQFSVKVVLSKAIPFRLELTSPLAAATSDMRFDIGPNLRPPTELTWVFVGGPTGPPTTQLQDFVDIHRDGPVLRFIPDVVGTYRFELTLDSSTGDFVPSFIDVLVEVLDARISPGELPETVFMWSILSDFYKLPPDREPIETIWSGMIQTVADELLNLYQVDYNKSLKDIQRTFQRKFQRVDTLQTITRPVLSQKLPFTSNLKLSGVDGTTLPDNIFEVLTATFVDDDVEPGDVVTFNNQTFAVSEVLSNTRLRLVGRNFTEDQTGLTWSVLFALWVRAEENLEVLSISPTDTVRFVATGPTGDVFRAEEEILLVRGRRAFLDPRTPEVIQALADRALSFDDLQTFNNEPVPTIEGIRRQKVFLVDKLILKVPVLEEIIPTPAAVFQSNLNYLVEPGRITIVEDFDGFTPFAVRKAEGLAGLTLINNVFEDAGATFISAGVAKGDTLHLGAAVFKISEVVSETRIRTAELLIAAQTGLSWRISHIAPDRLWAEFINLDNTPSIQANFGHLVNLTADEAAAVNFDYLSAVRGLFKSFFSGPTLESIRVGLEILNGLPVAEEPGEIIEITSPVNARIGRIRIKDIANPGIVRIYFYPQDLGLADITDETGLVRPLQIGDTVTQFQSLSRGVDIEDYITSPKWWVPFANQGLLNELEKFATFKATVSDKIFEVENIDFILTFLESIKPTYVKLAFIVRASLFSDDIEVREGKASTITRKMRTGVFVPVLDLDEIVDGAGSAIKRLDFDTNFPFSVSPHLELAEVSKFENLDTSAVPPLARLSDIRDPEHAVLRSTSTRFGIGSVQPDGITFISVPGSFAPADLGKNVIINGFNRVISAVLSDTTIQVSPVLPAFSNVPWAITESTGTITIPLSGDGELEDISANFENGSGLPLVDEGDFLELLHPDFNGGAPTLVHVLRTVSNTKIEFSNFTTLFDKASAAFPQNTHVDATWTIFRGLRYMPKPAISDVDFGDNNVLSESLVPPARVIIASIASDANPADDTGDSPTTETSLSDGTRDSGTTVGLGSVDTSLTAVFSDISLISVSAEQPIDGAVAVPFGRPIIRKIRLWDIPSGTVDDGFLVTKKEIQVFTADDESLDFWTLHETFNTPSTKQAMRFGKITEIILTIPLPADIKGIKLHFPNGLDMPDGAAVAVAEMELYLSAEFDALPKNHRLDLVDDSRPEDVLGFQRKLPSSTSMSGTGTVAAGGIIFTDLSFGGIAFCSHDLGKSIVIDGETRTIVKVTAAGAAIEVIEVDSALSGAPKGPVVWAIAAGALDLVDGNTQ